MKIELRKWEMADADKLAAICNAADRRYLANRLPFPYTRADAEWWLNMVAEKEGKEGTFRAIVVNGNYVGNISVEKKADVCCRDGEIGYFLAEEEWSKGIMTEAVRQICPIAFAELDLIRISGNIFAPNVGSRRVLEKNGFVLEGVLKNAVFKDGNVYDFCVYGKCQ